MVRGGKDGRAAGHIISLIPEPEESRVPRYEMSRDQEAHMRGCGGILATALPFTPSTTQLTNICPEES